MENISEYLDNDEVEQLVSVYADKGYDAKRISEYLRKRNITDCSSHRNFKIRRNKTAQNRYNKTRYVVDRFFAWLKCGFHRTRIRYERIAENYLGFVHVACNRICLECPLIVATHFLLYTSIPMLIILSPP